jgi:DNA-binding LacI/PurR family transcriptional regulator
MANMSGTTASKPETRKDLVSSHLRELAFRHGPHAKIPSVRELRSMFQASQSTIIDAISELENQKILYRKDKVGIFVSEHLHSKTILLLLGSGMFHTKSTWPFWDTLCGRFIREAQLRGKENDEDFRFYIVMDDKAQQDLVHQIQPGRVHGVLGVGVDDATAEWLMSRKIPFVAFAGLAHWAIDYDIAIFADLGVQALAEQGCRRIALWHPTDLGPPQAAGDGWEVYDVAAGVAQYAERSVAFRGALEKHGLAYYPEIDPDTLPDMGAVESETHQHVGYRTAMRIFGSADGPKPDGILISDDMMAAGALVAFQKLGITVGTDIKVASHANTGSPTLFGHDDDLARIEFDPEDMIQAMFGTLDLLMRGGEPESRSIRIPPVLLRARS